MYGTTMKNYSMNRASSIRDGKRVASKEVASNTKKTKKMEEKDTRYVKIKS